MSEQAAQSWLSSHPGPLPALDLLQQQAVRVYENPNRALGDLAEIIALDPGMSVTLYQQVNGKLAVDGKARLDTTHAALLLLGSSAIADLIMQHKTLSQIVSRQDLRQTYQQLLCRIYHLLDQLEEFISFQGIRSLQPMRSAALLHNVGELYVCVFAFEQYRQFQTNFQRMGSEVISAKPIFGFDLRDLGRVICRKMHLPGLVLESLEDDREGGRKARLIQLAADISHQAEVGWYHAAMKATQEVCADYLNQSIDAFENHIQRVAIESARRCPIDDVMPAAARLILLPDLAAGRKPKPAMQKQPDNRDDYESRVKQLLGSGRVSATRLLEGLLDHLEQDLQMSRVVLLLLSKDRAKLGTRASRGVKPHSSIHHMLIDVAGNNLIHSLLQKPLGLWIEPGNYGQYKPLLPKNFKSHVLSERFFLMSLFNGKQAIGLVFCDRAQAVNDLDKASYIRFKAAALLTSKALRYLAKQTSTGTDS